MYLHQRRRRMSPEQIGGQRTKRPRSKQVLLVVACAVVAAVIPTVLAPSASACGTVPGSLAGGTRARLTTSSAAFIGTLLAQDPAETRLTRRVPSATGGPTPGGYEPITVKFRYRVDHLVKGVLAKEITLEKTYSGATSSCGTDLPPEPTMGKSVGVLLFSPSHDGNQDFATVGAGRLEQAGKEPSLRGDPKAGRAALVMSGYMPPGATLMSIDGKGRIVAFGSGGEVAAMSICPGERRMVSLEGRTRNPSPRPAGLVVRAVDGLRELHRYRFSTDLGKSATISCRSDSGADVVMSNEASLVRVRNGAVSTISSDFAGPVAFARTEEVAYVTSGPDQATVRRVDLVTGRGHPVAAVAANTKSLALSPDEDLLAAVGEAPSGEAVLLLVDLAAHATVSTPLGESDYPTRRQSVWLDNDHVGVQGPPGKIFDRKLRFVRPIPNLPPTARAAVVDKEMLSVSETPEDGYAVTATHASGEVRTVVGFGDDYYITALAAINHGDGGAGKAVWVASAVAVLGLATVVILQMTAVRRRRRGVDLPFESRGPAAG